MFFDTKVYSTVTSSYSLLPKPSSAAASIVRLQSMLDGSENSPAPSVITFCSAVPSAGSEAIASPIVEKYCPFAPIAKKSGDWPL